MATVRETIELQDKMSPVLGNIIRSLRGTISVMKKLDASIDDSKFKKIENDLLRAENALADFNNELDDTPVKINKMSKEVVDSAKGISIFGSAIGGFIANAATNLIGDALMRVQQAIEFASNLAEVQNVVDVTFGESANEINEWSKTALKAYGLNELSAKKYVGTMGAMLTSTGIAREEILGMSKDMVALAGDMASFYNLSSQEVFDKIRAGISGETEPLKSLGINMSDANLEAFALSQNMEKVWKDMSYAEKTMVRYKYLLSVTKNAQGDFTRTADQFANRQRVFTESLNQTLALFASNLLPLLSAGMAYGIQFFDFVIENWESINSVIMVVGTTLLYFYLPTLLKVAATQMKTAYGMASAWAIAHWPLLLVIGSILVLIAMLNKAGISFQTMANYAGKALGFLYALAYNVFANLYNLIASFIEFFVNGWKDPLGYLQKLFLNIGDIVLGVLEKIANAMDKIFDTNYGEVIGGWRKDVANLASGMVQEGDFKIDRMDMKDFTKTMDEIGKMTEDFVFNNDAINPLKGVKGTEGPDGTPGNPVNTKVGNKLEISDESIKLMKDVAQIESIRQYTALKPEMKVTIENIRETADVNVIDEKIAQMFEEAYEASLES